MKRWSWPLLAIILVILVVAFVELVLKVPVEPDTAAWLLRLLVLFVLIWGVVSVVRTQIEARKVRDGWVDKNFKGTREEFVARYRHQLGWNGWTFLVVGALTLTLALVAFLLEGAASAWSLTAGVSLLVIGIALLWSRRISDAPTPT